MEELWLKETAMIYLNPTWLEGQDATVTLFWKCLSKQATLQAQDLEVKEDYMIIILLTPPVSAIKLTHNLFIAEPVLTPL